jgi:hypothetical protein
MNEAMKDPFQSAKVLQNFKPRKEFGLGNLSINISDLFRISIFGFRI